MELKKRFEKFKKLSFPISTYSNKELEDIHAELVLFDEYIAGNLNSLLAGKTKTTVELDYDNSLELRIRRFIKNGEKDKIELAQLYLSYILEIKRIIEMAKNEFH